MAFALSPRDGPELKQRWRRQVASRQRRRFVDGPRSLAAITYLTRGQRPEGLVDIRDLTVVVLHDVGRDDDFVPIRFAGYAVASVPWGIKIGGASSCKFDKDLALPPSPQARGRRFDLSNHELLCLALKLDQVLDRHSRYPHFPRRQQPRWPKLWAAFAPGSQIELAGPEFESDRQGTESSRVSSLSRTAAGLTLYPLSYVSHAWRQILVIFADLTTIPKRQVIALDPHARNLRGYDGAIEFDLLGSRFASSAPSRQRATTRKHMTAMLAS